MIWIRGYRGVIKLVFNSSFLCLQLYFSLSFYLFPLSLDSSLNRSFHSISSFPTPPFTQTQENKKRDNLKNLAKFYEKILIKINHKKMEIQTRCSLVRGTVSARCLDVFRMPTVRSLTTRWWGKYKQIPFRGSCFYIRMSVIPLLGLTFPILPFPSIFVSFLVYLFTPFSSSACLSSILSFSFSICFSLVLFLPTYESWPWDNFSIIKL